MAELDTPVPESIPTAPIPLAAPDLTRKVRGLVIWLVVLSVMVGLLTIAIGVAGFALWSFQSEMYGSFGQGSQEDQSAPIEQAVKNAWGDDLESVSVKEVEVDFGEIVGGPSIFGMSEQNPRVWAVTYKLKGSDVSVSGLVGGSEDFSMTGLLPTEGSLASRLDATQVVTLMKAWAAKSDKPMGGVRAYADPEMMDPGMVRESVEVAGKEYPTKSLWRVGEGRDAAAGEKISIDEMDQGRDLIFYRDAKTDEWVFLGSERSEMSIPF